MKTAAFESREKILEEMGSRSRLRIDEYTLYTRFQDMVPLDLHSSIARFLGCYITDCSLFYTAVVVPHWIFEVCFLAEDRKINECSAHRLRAR